MHKARREASADAARCAAHLLYSIDLSVERASDIRRLLTHLNKTFGTDRIKVDEKVFNPCRVTVHGGHTLSRLKQEGLDMSGSLVAAIYVRPGAEHLVDLFHEYLPTPHLLEWNLFNRSMNHSDVATSPRQFGYARECRPMTRIRVCRSTHSRSRAFRRRPFSWIRFRRETERPGLTKCLATLTSGDVLVVWRLDRLGRSMRHLITLVEDLRNKGIGFRSLNEGAIDTSSASGELIFNIFSALAQFERRLTQERTKAGLAAARARGRHGGRPKVSANDPKVDRAKQLNADKTLDIDDICKTLRISRSTFYRYMRL